MRLLQLAALCSAMIVVGVSEPVPVPLAQEGEIAAMLEDRQVIVDNYCCTVGCGSCLDTCEEGEYCSHAPVIYFSNLHLLPSCCPNLEPYSGSIAVRK